MTTEELFQERTAIITKYKCMVIFNIVEDLYNVNYTLIQNNYPDTLTDNLTKNISLLIITMFENESEEDKEMLFNRVIKYLEIFVK